MQTTFKLPFMHTICTHMECCDKYKISGISLSFAIDGSRNPASIFPASLSLDCLLCGMCGMFEVQVHFHFHFHFQFPVPVRIVYEVHTTADGGYQTPSYTVSWWCDVSASNLHYGRYAVSFVTLLPHSDPLQGNDPHCQRVLQRGLSL